MALSGFIEPLTLLPHGDEELIKNENDHERRL
jgi:hypothetical protein